MVFLECGQPGNSLRDRPPGRIRERPWTPTNWPKTARPLMRPYMRSAQPASGIPKEMAIGNNEAESKFDLPKRDWAAKLSCPTINLYFYDIRENPEFRRNERIVERSDNGSAPSR